MPDKNAMERAQRDKREGKSPSTQAGEFIREELRDIRQGKHGARSAKQAIAIGLSEARRAGVDLPPPSRGKVSEKSRRSAERDYEVGQGKRRPARRPKISRAVSKVLKDEPRSAASHLALSRQAHASARKRNPAERSAAAQKAARTKGPAERSAAARKAARTRARNASE
jgi:hypothetical protein